MLTGMMLVGACSCGDDEAPPTAGTSRPDEMDSGRRSPDDDAGLPPLPKRPDAKMDEPVRMDAGTRDAEVVPIDPEPDAGDNVDLAGPAPEEWTCSEALWAERDSTGDFICDCGCGAIDFADCLGNSCLEEDCDAPGCDVCRTSDGQYRACDAPDPDDSKCSPQDMGNDVCDCGCEAQDPTCAGDGCLEPGCFTQACDVLHDRSGDPLPKLTNAWQCSPDRFGDGTCDCGCGEPDSDCFRQGCDTPGCQMPACIVCHAGGDYVIPCDEDSADWNTSTCRPYRFGSGDGCDEDCGATDPDCSTAVSGDPHRCWGTNSLQGCNVPLASADPDEKWTCHVKHYGTGDGCDCGCGAPDPDCGDAGCQSGDCSANDSCDYCHDGTYLDTGDAADYLVCHGWDADRCTADMLTDGTCDCGCGALDPDCRQVGRVGCAEPGCAGGTCQTCWDSEGASSACAEWDLAACDAELARDGVCDCGCGARDPDCAEGEGCAEKGCRAPGCDLCHVGDTGLLQACGDWHCDWAAYADGETCDCGCGAPDPDCGSGVGRGCIQPGCRDIKGNPRADECEVCHDHLGRPVACAPK